MSDTDNDKKQAAPAKRPRGGQTTYDPAIVDQIIERLSNGEPLREICRSEGMPAWRTVYDWLRANEEFSTRFAQARELGEDAIAQECLDIADNARNDWMERQGSKSEGWVLNGEHVQRSKLRIETRLKLLAKWNPKKYGEKVDLNHGGQKDNPITSLLGQIVGTPLTPEQVKKAEEAKDE